MKQRSAEQGSSFRNWNSRACAWFVIANLVLAPMQAIAEEGPPPAASGGVTRSADPCDQKEGMNSSSLQQVGAYCAAAKAAEKAASGQKIMGGVHSAIAGICIIPCMSNSFVGMGDLTFGHICKGASVAGTISEIAITQQFMSAMGGLMGAYGLFNSPELIRAGAANKFGEKAIAKATLAKGKTHSHDMMSCLTAGVESLSAFMSFNGAKSSSETANQNRQMASQLVDSTLNPTPATGSASLSVAALNERMGGAGSIGGQGAAPRQSGAGSASGAGDSLKVSGGCSSNTVSGQLECARAVGGKIPSFVGSPEFQKTVEGMSGMPMNRLLAMDSPKQVMQAMNARGLGADGTAKLGAALDQFEKDLRAIPGSGLGAGAPAAVMASGSRGGGAGGSGGDDPAMAALGNLLAGLNPNKGPEEGPPGATSETFGARKDVATAAHEEDDPRISLFDRISRRYSATLSRGGVAQLRYASPQNQALQR